jgi:hypothetical protein
MQAFIPLSQVLSPDLILQEVTTELKQVPSISLFKGIELEHGVNTLPEGVILREIMMSCLKEPKVIFKRGLIPVQSFLSREQTPESIGGTHHNIVITHHI